MEKVISPYSMGWDPNVKPDPYNTERAKKLLAEAGYPNGFQTTLNTTAGTRYWIEAIAANLADVGIKAEIKVWETAAITAAYPGKKLRGLIIRNSWYDAEQTPGRISKTPMPWKALGPM